MGRERESISPSMNNKTNHLILQPSYRMRMRAREGKMPSGFRRGAPAWFVTQQHALTATLCTHGHAPWMSCGFAVYQTAGCLEEREK